MRTVGLQIYVQISPGILYDPARLRQRYGHSPSFMLPALDVVGWDDASNGS